MLNKIRDALLYSGLTKDSYEKVKDKVSLDNQKTVGRFSMMTTIAFTIVFFINIIKSQNVAGILYILPSIGFFLMWLVNKTLTKKYPIVSDILSVLYALLLLAAGVYIGINQSGERTTLLLPFFVYASTVFTFRLIFLVVMMLGSEILYLCMAFQTQSGNILTVNIVNTIIFCVIGIYVGIFLMKMKYQKFETEINNLYLSEMDSLTDVYNRRSFDKYIEYLKTHSKNHEVGIIMFDIDFFKKYNDFYGHFKGDEVLIDVVKPIKDYIKQYNDCYLFRYGGEEFAVVIDSPEERVVKEIAIDINNLIYQENIPRDDINEFSRITVSVGASIETIPNITGDYITNADNQLYSGKNSSRNSAYYKNKSLLTKTDIATSNQNISGNYIMYQVLTYLCQDYYDIYSVDCKTKRVTVYRSGGEVLGITRVLKNDYDYESSFKAYIDNNIHPLDREKVYKKIEFDNVYKAVKEYGVVSIYYRVLRDNATSFYKIKFIPMGTKDNFDSMICAFIPEDVEVGDERNSRIDELDSLTNIYSKIAFYHYAKQYIDDNPRKKFKVVVSDIENFRVISMIYGKTKANELLQYFAKQYSNIKSCCVIGRYGHDQFVMLLEDKEGFDEEFKNEIETIKNSSPIPYLSLKYGLYEVDNIDEPIDAICGKAQLALEDIKHKEDNPISIYDEKLEAKALRIKMLESSFEKAFANNEFKVHCQPKYRKEDGKICGGEALLRWKNESGETIPPSEFVPIYERIGVINRLDEQVFKFVCEKQKELLDKGITPLPVSVNVSRNTLYQPMMLDKYKEIIESYGVDKKLVPFEITETWSIDNFKIKDIVKEIKDAGFVIHLDDFGTGYSSLSSLSDLSIDAVKLDKSLIDGIDVEKSKELLHHVVDLAHYLKMEIVVEGVETKEQYDFLEEFDVEVYQGYYFSKTIEYDKYMDLVIKEHNS